MRINPHTFIAGVQAAHSIATAHRAGAHTLQELTKRVGLRATEVLAWCDALSLPVTGTAQRQHLLLIHPTQLYQNQAYTPEMVLAPVDRTGDR
jgi:hypothetical protein